MHFTRILFCFNLFYFVISTLVEFKDIDISDAEAKNFSSFNYKNEEKNISLTELFKFTFKEACREDSNFKTVIYENYIKINISNGNYNALDQHAFQSCSNFLVINFYASHNYIQSLPEYFFYRVPEIKHIDLSYNNISKYNRFNLKFVYFILLFKGSLHS